MTVVAWDGKRLAADKLADSGGYPLSVIKIAKVGDLMCAGAGDSDYIQAMKEWVSGGFQADAFPDHQKGEETAVEFFTVDSTGSVRIYCRSPWPLVVGVGQCYAIGSGAPYALAAMHLGRDAEEAVRTAIELDLGCGVGIDIATLDGGVWSEIQTGMVASWKK